MQRKKEMINKLSSLPTSNIDFDWVIEFVLRVIYNRLRTETSRGDSLCFLSRKKGRKENFQILIDYHLTNRHSKWESREHIT